MDPPFRSRFQARYISIPSYEELFDYYNKKFNVKQYRSIRNYIDKLCKLATVFQNIKSDRGTKMHDFPFYLDKVIELKCIHEELNICKGIQFCYPIVFLNCFDQQMRNICIEMFKRFEIDVEIMDSGYCFVGVNGEEMVDCENFKRVQFSVKNETNIVKLIPSGPHESSRYEDYVITNYHLEATTDLMIALTVGNVCLLGEKGIGKSRLMKHVAGILGYQVVYMSIYRDMSARDFLQTRDTDINGNTVWRNSPLVDAALNGHLCVLDPIECLAPGVISSLSRLLQDHEATLPNGTLLVSHHHFNKLIKDHKLSAKSLHEKNIFPVNRNFRVIAMARPLNSSREWIDEEILTMFLFIPLNQMSKGQELTMLSQLFLTIPSSIIENILSIAIQIRNQTFATQGYEFSTRQLIRILKRLQKFPNDDLFTLISRVFLIEFLPIEYQNTLLEFLTKNKIEKRNAEILKIEKIQQNGKKLIKIGNVLQEIREFTDPLLVPNTLFYENQKQLFIIQVFLLF